MTDLDRERWGHQSKKTDSFGRALRPFDESDCLWAERVIQKSALLVYLCFKALTVEVSNLSRGRFVAVRDRIARARNWPFNTQLAACTTHKGRLPRSNLTADVNNVAGLQLESKLGRYCLGISLSVGYSAFNCAHGSVARAQSHRRRGLSTRQR